MPINWNEPDFVFLRQQLELGRVILFAGAGFSFDARNHANERPPLGAKLAELLANKAGFPYADEKLPNVYEAVRGKIGENALWEYLQTLYEIANYADWYQTVRSITWNRIYTTNIDNLFEKIYSTNAAQHLNLIVNPANHQERDQLFRKVQCVALHGHINYRMNGLVFTLPEFGAMTAKHNPWYSALVDDLHNWPVVFIGSTLEEPMLYHYLNIRNPRDRGVPECRPKSFLVCPNIGPINTASLLERNIAAVECSGAEFFTSLAANIPLADLSLPAVRKKAIPHVTYHGDSATVDERVNRYFDFIVPNALPYQHKSKPDQFFMGAEPEWYDIAENRDGMRAVTQELVDLLSAKRGNFACFVVHGPAGSGKTTTLMRAAQVLAAKGLQVFYAKNMERLDLSGILRMAEEPANKDKRFVVFLDILSRNLAALQYVSEQLKAAKNISVVVADRTNKYVSLRFPVSDFTPEEIRMPDLCEADVTAIIAKLKEFGFLGKLRGKSTDDQIQAFMIRADKQLLVALREATSGEGFDFILRTEYSELAPPARLAYAICCIAVAHGAPGVYTRHLLPCLGKTEFKKAAVIQDLLRGVLVPANQTGTMLKPRHRLIAQWVANEIAAQGEKVEAVTTFLKQIAPDINPNEIKRRSPAYLAYRGMINSEGLKETFSKDHDIILGIYEELKPYYDTDFLFWLQFGMANKDAGRLDIAENYLEQSLAIYPNSHQTLHHMGCLNLIRAARAHNAMTALDKANEGIALLREQIHTKGDENSYPYHAYLTFVGRWYQFAGNIITQKEWEALRNVGVEATKKYSRDEMIRDAVMEVERFYLQRIVTDKPADPSPPA